MSAEQERALAVSLQRIAETAKSCRDDWWIIGSAAAHLSGADVGRIHDIDLLLSERDAHHFLSCWPAPAHSGGATEQFRSRVFARFDHLPMPVEIMGCFDMRIGGAWRQIQPKTRTRRGEVFTPDVAEQIELLMMMNRSKDQARLTALRALSAEQ